MAFFIKQRESFYVLTFRVPYLIWARFVVKDLRSELPGTLVPPVLVGSLYLLYHCARTCTKIHLKHHLCTSSTTLKSMYNSFLHSDILYLSV
jgi:hypothetical protein